MNTYLRLPFPPSIWQAYYRRGTASIKSKAYIDFKKKCLTELRRAEYKLPPGNELEMSIQLFSRSWYTKATKKKPARIRKRDVDNYLKCVIDVITEFFRSQDPGFDDSRIFALYATKDVPARPEDQDFCLISISARHPRNHE